MKNIAVLNAVGIRPQAFETLLDGKSSLDLAFDRAQAFPSVCQTVLLSDGNAGRMPECRILSHEHWTDRRLLEAFKELGSGYDNIYYFFADCPLLDARLAETMLRNHARYSADYSFADGYPYGLTPEILSVRVVDALLLLTEKEQAPLQRETVFEVVKKDINSFDIETEIAPKDLRLLRVSLSADSRRNLMLLKRIVAAGGRDAETVCRILDAEPSILRTLPAYVTIQAVAGAVDHCVYDPWGVQFPGEVGLRRAIDTDGFAVAVQKIADFCEDAVVTLSAFGEPGLHPRILDLIRIVGRSPRLSLIIETSGKGWPAGVVDRIAEANETPPMWIVFLDAHSETAYRSVRGEGFAEACECAGKLLSLFPDRTYVQAVRMKDNEEDLERFYRAWKERTENVIVQKYDSVCGLLADRRATDLSPLKRMPCWHLKRDLHIAVDGTVPLCREDVRNCVVLGNVLEEPLPQIWERGEVHYADHVAERYLDMCKRCDEYYTYNF